MRTLVRMLLVSALLLIGILAPSTTAQASDSECQAFGLMCARAGNGLKTGYMLTARDWCGPGETLLQYEPPCPSTLKFPASERPEDHHRFLSPGQHTPAGQDWNVFRVEADCYVEYLVHRPKEADPMRRWSFRTSDRRGLIAEWIRVHPGEDAQLTYRECLT